MKGVIAQFHSGIQPHGQSFDALVHLAPFVEPGFVHEPDSRNFLLLQDGQQFRGHFREAGRGGDTCVSGGQIVNGDGDLALRGILGVGKPWSDKEESKSRKY